MKIYVFVTIVLVNLSLHINAQEPLNTDFFSINLNDVNWKNTKSDLIFKKFSTAVVLFLNNECPVCQYYASKINYLDSICNAENVKFICVFSGKYSENELKYFKELYQLTPLFYLDKKNKMAQILKASITPEIFLISLIDNKVVYRGCIDDSYVSLGVKRNYVSENYFANALKYHLNNNRIEIFRTNPIGCMINY